jgi:hypothetical protein
MNRRHSSLDPELESLVRPPKIERRAPPELRMRALARARAFVAANGVSVPARPSSSPTLVSIPSAPRRARRRIAFAAALAVAAGTAGAVAAFRRRAAEPAPVVTPVSGSSIRARVAAQPAPGAPAGALPVRPERAPKARSAASIRSGGAAHRFTAELELLQRAQVAYTRREFSTALALIAEHARRFVRGHLAEEREALRVRCLRGAGRTEEAHRAATEFAVRFPRSVLLSRVDSAESD